MSIFSKIQAKKPRTNTFDLSHDRKFSCPFGMIVPILVMETVPGDKFHLSTSQLLRFAPLVAPVMHQVSVYTHFFFVPNRLVWSNWEDFITGGEDGLDTSVFPYLETGFTHGVGSIWDYLGLPTDVPDTRVSAIPFAAYQLIYNEYYRDQNLQTGVGEIADPVLVDGDNSANSTLRS